MQIIEKNHYSNLKSNNSNNNHNIGDITFSLLYQSHNLLFKII
jgi:hypothetical protein